MSRQSSHSEAVVTGVGGNIVSIQAPAGAIIKNEVANICVGDEKLKSEVLRVQGDTADIQEMRDKNRIFRKQLYQLEQVCGDRASSMEILKAVSDTLPEDTYLRQMSCSHEEIKLRGYSKEPDKLPELVMSMPFVDTISTSEIGSERDGYYDFNLSASLRR